MFLGIDHGTTAVRVATIDYDNIKKIAIQRNTLAIMSEYEIINLLTSKLDIQIKQVKMAAITYSMGDGINSIENINKVINRGIISNKGVGVKTGAGERVFDAIKCSQIPTFVIPGIHAKSSTDSRLNIFSHSTSPEKIGIAYHSLCKGFTNFVISDISSNTVTLAVASSKLVGAIDACIFAPGIHHGPLDVLAIRDVDSHKYTANEAFTTAGVIKRTPYSNLAEILTGLEKKEQDAILALDTISLFSAMEITSLQLLLKEQNGTFGDVILAGSVAEVEYVTSKINELLDINAHILNKWSAAIGCAEIARDIYKGKNNILGINVKLD